MIMKNKYLLVIAFSTALTILGSKAFSQTPPTPPPPPPSPVEVFNKINPFRKKNKNAKKDSIKKDSAKVTTTPPAPVGPPPPPNPLNLFKKKKKDTTKTQSPQTK